MKLYFDLTGWIGASLILGAYFLISTKRLEVGSSLYHLLNIAGSALLIANTIYYKTYPLTALNCVWMIVGISMLLKSKH